VRVCMCVFGVFNAHVQWMSNIFRHVNSLHLYNYNQKNAVAKTF